MSESSPDEISGSEEPTVDQGVISESPPEDDGPKSMLDAVQAALEGQKSGESSTSAGKVEAEGDSKPKAEVEAAKKPEDDLSEEALARLNKETQKRIRD